MTQKSKFIFTSFIFTTFIFTTFCFSQQKVIKNINPADWEMETIVPGQSCLYGKGIYSISSVSSNFLKGLMLYDNYKNKKTPFSLNFEVTEDVTVYVFMYGNNNEWSTWPISKDFIKWKVKRGRKESKYFMRYKKFLKGKITLNYQPQPGLKAGTRPFFIVTSKSLLLQKKTGNSKGKIKLISLKRSDKAVSIDGIISGVEQKSSTKINLYLPEQGGKKVSTKLPQEKTDVFISRDKSNLYIGAICYKNKGNIILTKNRTNVADLWQDECFEVYIQPERGSVKYIQIMINSLGCYYIVDKTSPERKNVELKIKTKKYSDRWELEIAVPLKLFPVHELMGINFTRSTYSSKQILKERTAWSTVRYDDVNNYGTLFLAGNDAKYNKKIVEELKDKYSKKIKKRANQYKNLIESPYNKFMLWPEPKFIKKFKGSIQLDTLKITDLAQAPNTANLLKEELKKKYNFVFKPQSKHSLIIGLLKNAKIQKILKEHKLQNRLKGKNPDSFIISISDGRVLISGNNKRGIYYGVRAFLKIVDHSTATGKAPSAAFVDIVDWPDQKSRWVFWLAAGLVRAGRPDINIIKQYIYNIAGSRYNGFVFQMHDALQYKSHPEIGHKWALSTEKFKDLIAFCRKHYIEPIPGMNTPGHAAWLVRKHKEMAESNIATICTRNPASLKLIFDIAEELIELCGGIGKVKYFHVGKDEIRWDKENGRGYRKIKDECLLCKGTPRKDLLLEYMKIENAFFKKRGIRMIASSDMFDKKRNGAHYETYKILKDLSRDIILHPWSAAGYPPIGKWTKMGFDVMKTATGYKVVSVFDDLSTGHVFNLCVSYPWMTLSYHKLSSVNYYNHLSLYLYGRNAWSNDLTLKPRNQDEWDNLKTTVQKRGEFKKLKFLMEYGNALNYFYNNKRFPTETNKFKEIDISAYCNTKLANCFNAGDMFDLSGLKVGKQIIAGIPTQIGEKIIVLQNNNVKNIKIAAKASSILFLYAAYLDFQKLKKFQKRIMRKTKFLIANKRSPIAYYIIKYDDGSIEKVTMNYGFNVGALCPPLHSRFTYDIRYVHKAVSKDQEWPVVQDCRDCTPGAPAAYQYEWVNPHPEKKIASIDFISMNSEVLPALIAITVRETK